MATPAPASAPITTTQPAPGWAWATLVILLLVLAIVGGVRSCNAARTEQEAARAEQAAPRSVPMIEALLLERECWTPCDANIAWPFKIRTEGRPLRIKFQGVAGWTDYPGEGDFRAPSNMQSGETQFVSPDEENLHVRVQVYRKVMVPAPGP
ncbi:hypothetical protein A3D42_00540 [Candidatus Nomurabacteria bacterium RIFCSPHIGHO2_02_FULL_41_18]|uniref:Uncharacterized protein n=1 Tax=Candidatus Nomurabacteria bacterium RIFCSPHIGHO2_02_FULL_41_18 TaxID=1801754 RepID=A0A1F6W7K7_9BACT|nr:MAG: hypothetical protein A2737_02555 [Candidatus Nomurabacteria bacterium RIFCSPHIGHO2_01_FULL_41_71]OGI77908.1 MAG: hypothetical protein A3D42_00540 [Candidatus Nomurabacteria bacterium RIFCSPHIGHO2_02_FULL_41_18]OGI90082.1 MAG: hypothetical protein A3B01_00960 [Candidatus Nomurabacteria bacterium RIFCSPLOWO2_01_FULL_41_52b]OGJ00251.1 MAG: hypothetical protein A3I90_01745 [Candidatus Nomurabacteria bacterium RIFCSPLOWO2_02_FULL_41_9]